MKAVAEPRPPGDFRGLSGKERREHGARENKPRTFCGDAQAVSLKIRQKRVVEVRQTEGAICGAGDHRFVREDLEPFAFAGLWEFARIAGEDILSATIIVREPNPLVAPVHDRMPVMLMPEDYDRWLDPWRSVDELRALLKPYDPALMKAYGVSRIVNSVKNEVPKCVEPLAHGVH